MSMTATIAGASVGIQNASFGTEDRIEERTRCSFTVIDLTGTTTFSKGQPVTITDSALGTMFTGYVNQPKATVLYPNPGRLWAIDCIDETWLADKRTSQKSYKNQFAGTVFVDQIQRYGAAEGLTCKAALRWDELLTDWQAGTLTGVAATTNATDGNVGDGDLELTRAGSQVVASGAGSGFSLVNGLLLTGYASSGYNAAYTNRQIWVGSQALHTGDAFLYDVWINSSSPAIKAGCDFICSDGTVFSGSATQDKQFLSPLTSTDLSGLANDQWYTRVFLIPAGLNGKTLSAVLVGLNSAAAGTYTTYFRRIEYEISGGGTVTFFGDSSTLQTNIQVNNQGYTNVSLTQVQLMDKTATVTPGALSISAAGIVQSSQMSWEQVLPNGCTILRETSIDNGASWQAIMSGSAVPNLLPGMVVTGRSVSYRDTLTLGSDPTVITIGVGSPTLTVSAAYAATKTDLISTTTTTANFVAGTLTNLATVGANGISLNGVQENWDDGDFSNQPMFGGGTLFQQVENKQMVLQTTTGFDLRSQLLFAGQWQNFTAEVDVTVYGTGSNAAGSVYRTSSGAWQNNNDTYAYTVMLSQTQLIFGRGTNSGSGAGAFTSIATATISLAANSVHRLKIIANGSNHQLFVDSVLLINATDATYPAAGYLGLRIFNGTGSTQSAAFDNFGVAAALSGTWQSPSINIAGPGTYGNSEVFWDIDGLPDSTTSITAQTSIDGGSTFQNVTNGGAISGLTAGGSLTGKTLILKLTLAASNAPVVPALNGATVWVMGQYSSSGTRSTAPLGYDTFVRANQSGWGNAIDGQSWTVGSGSGTAAIASDTGTLTATGGGTTLMHLGSGSAADMGATCRVKYTNAASAVRVGVRYTSASGGTMYTAYLSSNQLGIQKFVAGAATTLASMTFTQTLGSYYQLQIVAQGTTISASAWLDGSASPTTFLLTATDSAIASGGFCVGANLATGDTATFNQFKATLYPDPGLSLANVGRAANSLVNWNANLPTNTSMTVQTSVDNGVTWSTISSAGNAVPNIATQPATIADSFTANTSANYTQSNFASGVTGTWTWDTSHSRLTGSGGTNGTLVHNPALTSADSQVMADFDQCDGSGVIANYIDSNNLYFMQVWDGSGTGTQNSVKLFKRSGGVTTQLGSTATIATWTRGNYRRFILDVQAGVLTASMDGVQLIQQTDGSPLAAGKSGLLLNTLVRCYNLRIQQYGQLLTSSNYLYSKVTLTSKIGRASCRERV